MHSVSMITHPCPHCGTPVRLSETSTGQDGSPMELAKCGLWWVWHHCPDDDRVDEYDWMGDEKRRALAYLNRDA